MSDLFRRDMIGGDRRKQVETTLAKIDKIFEEIWNNLFKGVHGNNVTYAGGGKVVAVGSPATNLAAAAAFVTQLAREGFTNAPTPTLGEVRKTKEELDLVHDIRNILDQAVGSYTGDDVKDELGDQIETIRDQIKTELRQTNGAPLGPENNILAREVSSRLKQLLRDFGDGSSSGNSSAMLSQLVKGEAEIARALQAIASAISHRQVAPAAGGRKYRI